MTKPIESKHQRLLAIERRLGKLEAALPDAIKLRVDNALLVATNYRLVGENDALTRQMVCRDMEYIGLSIDLDKNNTSAGGIREISQPESKVKILVVPTNEELEIANQCFELLK